MKIINEKEFENEIKDQNVLIDFYADWCGPCRMLSGVLEEVSNEINIEIKKVNVDECPNIARKYGVMSIPTLILFDNSKELKRQVGYMNKEQLKEFVK
ncbi:MAG: thioredoxin [bacterium]|nr:thioredoxin [bacterium]